MHFRENGKIYQTRAVGWYLGWWLGIGASRVIVWGLWMIDAQLALGVERKSQTIKYITEIRVGKTTTLKIANYL